MTKYVDLIAWEDCPHLQPPFVSQEELDEMERRMLPHQRQARRKGRPSLGAGAIYPVEEDHFVIEPFKIPKFWQRGYAMDVGWNCTAALLGARDPDSGTCYLTHEYYSGRQQPSEHATGIKAMLPWPKLMGCIDPAAENSNQKDGTKLKREYEQLGLKLQFADNAREAGLLRVLNMLQDGELKVFNTLRYFLKEFRLYRRDEKGRVVKKNDHLMDCMRYLLFTKTAWRRPPSPKTAKNAKGEW